MRGRELILLVKQISGVICGVLLLVLLSSYGGAWGSSGSERVLYVGMILARGGLGDRSFNDSAYAGLMESQERFGIRLETADFTSKEANLEALRHFARQEYDLIIGVGFEHVVNIGAVAEEFPDGNFAIIDAVVEGNNVASIIYREQEGDFLMGVLAAMLTKSKKVGFIGGMDIPIIRRIGSGFMQGVAY
ncbi:MAG: BMP family protein [bacterium]